MTLKKARLNYANAMANYGPRNEETMDALVILQPLEAAAKRKNDTRKARDQVMRDTGLVRVRGALGGVYWE